MLHVQSTLPDLQLRPYVRSYVQRESGASDQQIVEPVVARLGVMLEFQFDRPFEIPIYGTDMCIRSPQIGVIGPMTQRTYRLLIRDHVEALTVLFRPHGFHAIFGIPTSTFRNAGIEGHSVLGLGVTRLFEQLGNTRPFAARVQLLNRFLLQSIACRQTPDRVDLALMKLTAAGSQIKISDAARQAGVTIRQLERKSLDCMGMSPKMVMRVARFQLALRMKSVATTSWSDVAYKLNYFDQMHMIRDFKMFAGEAPGRALEQIATDHLISL